MKLRYTALALGTLIALNLLVAAHTVQAQTVPPTHERVRLADNELGCQALFSEIGQMEALAAVPVRGATAPTTEATVGGQVAGAVAQQALTQAAGRSGFGGLFGGLIGAVAKEATPPPQQPQTQVAQQALAVAAGQGRISPAAAGGVIGGLSALSAQAQAGNAGVSAPAAQALSRKEHLTTLFVAKGCKASELQR